MKKTLRVNTKIIKKLKPCEDRFNNWKLHYRNFDGDVFEFLNLRKITAQDKIWVVLNLLKEKNDLFTIQVFALDCAFAAAYAGYAAANAGYAAEAAGYAAADADATTYTAAVNAAYAAYYAAYAAGYAAADAAYAAYAGYAVAVAAEAAGYAVERKRQIDCLAYLLEASIKKKEDI